MAKSAKRIYMDYASTTPVDPAVFSAMKPYFSEEFANPSALYREAVAAKKAVENARASLAKQIGAHPDEIIFTGSGTESVNLAILGTLGGQKITSKPHLVMTVIEHPAVLEAAAAAAWYGSKISQVTVSETGLIDPKDIKKAITPDTVLVSVMYANNEIGTIQPIHEVAKIVRHARKERSSTLPYFHTDASQAANYLDIHVDRLGVDLMTLDGSKIYGPKGIGILYARRGVPLRPIIFGGGQERSLRSGTENVALIVGIARALEITTKIKEKESKRLTKIRDYCISEIKKNFPDTLVNGDEDKRLPNNVNVCFPKLDSEFLVLSLDAQRIMASAATACLNIGDQNSSYVIEATGRKECAASSLRFTFGRGTKKSDITALIKALKNAIALQS
ncbi:cysteine desulfurase [Candidatus Parcubacteria bacterium]|nr:cysteine desulfurase [Candidatus Parcubacteria bacterium]